MSVWIIWFGCSAISDAIVILIKELADFAGVAFFNASRQVAESAFLAFDAQVATTHVFIWANFNALAFRFIEEISALAFFTVVD